MATSSTRVVIMQRFLALRDDEELFRFFQAAESQLFCKEDASLVGARGEEEARCCR